MRNLIAIISMLILSNISTGFANELSTEEQKSLDSSKENLSCIRDKIKEIDHDAFEQVDGYQDPELMKTASECKSALAEAEGTLMELKRAAKCKELEGVLSKNASSFT